MLNVKWQMLNVTVALLVLVGICVPAYAQPTTYSFAPLYWTTGTVNSIDEADANGRQIVFFKSLDEYYSGLYASDIVGSSGSAGAANRGMVNIFSNLPSYPLEVGGTYYVGVVQDEAGYGAGPVEFTVSGRGYDEVPPMTMALGAGVPPAPSAVIETYPPVFKEIWFGSRLYHKSIYGRGAGERGETFITSPSPLIKTKVVGTGSSGIDSKSIIITANEGSANETTYRVADADLKDVEYLAGESGIVNSLNVEYQVPEDEVLPDGENVLVFTARDALGLSSTSETTYIQVAGGEMAVIGPVVTYPSPYSPTRDGDVTIQYTLSRDGDVQIFLYSIAGELVKRIYLYSGREGGTAGLNKITWNGRTTFNEYVGNGIYMGTIFFAGDNKTLAKFKLTVVH
ncbi:MAG: hypothetical protein ABIJ26_05040 [Candidatus Margulisiibacteriota bacterium]|nr:hypothetical protein [Candidatus Margulisiibacteriota bacterium]